MNIREYLTNLLKDFREQRAALNTSMISAETVEERQAISESIATLETQINETDTQLRSLPQGNNQDITNLSNEQRTFNPISSYGLNMNGEGDTDQEQRENDPTSTMQYRSAFMQYCRTGQADEVLVKRESSATSSQDLGILIPSTIMQEIIKGVEKTRGQLYTKVKKTNLKGGIKYPLGTFSATFKRITETTVSERQKGGSITGFIEFSYNIGEIRLSKTLLENILSVPAFESELSEIMVKAYIEAMDAEILKGDPTKNELEGILTNAGKSGSRIIKKNIIEFTNDEIIDWTSWERKLFAEIPISMEKENPEFVLAKQTYVSNLCTMKDTTGQPIKKAGFDASDKLHKFNEYEVNRVEKDLFKDFDSCVDGEYFGMFWVPEKAFAINSNLEFTVTHYFDHETNMFVDKALVVNDGKVLDAKYIYLLKKKVVAA